MRLVTKHDIVEEWEKKVLLTEDPHTHRRPPLSRLPCANQDPNLLRACDKPGTRHCSACRLVGYCSQDCQKEHWKQHKKDCKDPIRSSDWQPDWVKERRTPAFMSPSSMTGWEQQSMYGMGQILWGNTPALDILNIACNEGQKKHCGSRHCSRIPSGDLRHIIRTVNGLPKNYSGRLTLRINDREPITIIRNILMLAILGLLSDSSVAAEHSLHIWYSVFLPNAYFSDVLPVLSEIINKLMSDDDATIDLSPSSTLSIATTSNLRSSLGMFVSNGSLDPGQANDAFTHVMNAPERVDYRHRYMAALRPSHRLAMFEWRRFGIVQPFGAFNAHLNTPNRWLFGPGGRLFMFDSANPLEGWNVDDVIESGKRCGATEEDIMGCLFFHVRAQLLEFAERLKRFNISIHVSAEDARRMAARMKAKAPEVFQGFDRIEVSNIVDVEYVGVASVLQDWGPLLNKDNEHAALVGTFMNWFVSQPTAKAESAGPTVITRLMKEIFDASQARGGTPALRGLLSRDPSSPELLKLFASMDFKYENSKAFLAYLRKVGADEAAERAGVRRRQRHTIVPGVRARSHL
ncbi:hypothetical protein EXIGLDRAFT_619572 [Exidia glandulosa HHB12029]|uniref:MYND-type domain-containing protein n=1 Tax=Exidia glandulosa HHB12029 TaxID=1314781 RepID=A0A165F3K0_EXIGL|nr:hypothetical protein EXIGLDRAFT_619572 [Exidia glandulosa HHB12029]